jgi:UDP-N-acetylglucosamine acyltransferase
MIHPTAIIDAKAKLHDGVEIGAYSIIGPEVEIGENTEVGHHVVIEGPTKIGSGNRIFPFATIGTESQDQKFKGEVAYLEIGQNNTIREYVTINRGTAGGGGITRVGSDGWFMACCHIAHDCLIGDGVTMANGSLLAGHVIIKNYVSLGGLTGVQQFCQIGEYGFTGGQSMITLDVAPFSRVAGISAKLIDVNYIGLERRGFLPEEIEVINQAYKIYFRSGLTRNAAIEKIESELPESDHVRTFIDFVKASERGVCR